ncbi:hypothetical protein HAHI6034_04700 [Hathewaya histolytica]|uniref:Uncharacterized protein n=1 Tax=Hathewaya histolytica TaxID=1498 RepID=A0A4U9R793_HATHI|nr:hypothetical protein [Hathewaya histolytica]VTQ87372.1 Uncharacterised protein [Hathewaya histolytica]
MKESAFKKNRASSKHVEVNKPNSSKDKKGNKKLPPTYENFEGEEIE